MSTPVIAFFNNKGGVGKTTLVYHLAWMFQDLNWRVVAADLDPQSNLTAGFLSEERLSQLWLDGTHPETLYGAIKPLLRGTGDAVINMAPELITSRLGLLAGDLGLSNFEDQLSEAWPKCLDRDERAFRVTSAFWRIMQAAAKGHTADLILMDLGPNLGAINRAALIAADFVVVPVSADLFSLQGLRNLGPKLRTWREDWGKRRASSSEAGLDVELPPGSIKPIGYVVQQHSVRLDRPVQAYERWIKRIPAQYHNSVLGQADGAVESVRTDPNCLAQLKHYRSLIPMAQESNKPMFHLKPADGAMGSHYQAAQEVRRDFQRLAAEIALRCGLGQPGDQSPALTPAGSSSSAGRS